MGLYHVGFHVSDWGCGWGQNIDGCSPLCFSAVQDEQRAPRTTTSKNISGLAALGCAVAGSTQNNGFKSFLKFLSGNYLPNSWVEFKLEGVPLSFAWFSSLLFCCAGPRPRKIYGLCSSGEHTIQMGWIFFWWSVLTASAVGMEMSGKQNHFHGNYQMKASWQLPWKWFVCLTRGFDGVLQITVINDDWSWHSLSEDNQFYLYQWLDNEVFIFKS